MNFYDCLLRIYFHVCVYIIFCLDVLVNKVCLLKQVFHWQIVSTIALIKNASGNDGVKVYWSLFFLTLKKAFSQLLRSALEQFWSLDSGRRLIFKEFLDVNGR